MKKILYLLFVLSISILMAVSCSKKNPVAPSQAASQGKITFALNAADNITSGKVTITKDAITETQPIAISNHTGSVVFNSIQVGTWNLLVQLFDANGDEIYTGNGTALVELDATTEVNITVDHNTGTMQINVLVPSPVIDCFDNDSSLESTPSQRDAAWVRDPLVYTMSMLSGFSGNNTACVRVNYTKGTGAEWAYILVNDLNAQGKYHDFSTTQHVSAKVSGPISILMKFRDINGNESSDVSIQTATAAGWSTLTWDLSSVNWNQCDNTHINGILLFVQPGQTGSGTFYLDDLMGDNTVQP
jgi:hypothetical protein